MGTHSSNRSTIAMFTEALVVTWISMCVVMAFAMVRVVIVPLASTKVKVYPALPTPGQLLFSNTVVSMLHSALSSLLAIWALLTSHSLNEDYINKATKEEFLATSISTGSIILGCCSVMLWLR
ncbi:hypothetical protein PsorP6_004519 [Peronosclerospora sorghi]|uniref:Uncharacterized protein n=1 Tax=Peronosclerospora sorghi TaxID=230839 RepID=A0ACC0VIM2_9STRA|nr:hypothetical protein PsorP6_004519 [Peronosclerospora sorghi]